MKTRLIITLAVSGIALVLSLFVASCSVLSRSRIRIADHYIMRETTDGAWILLSDNNIIIAPRVTPDNMFLEDSISHIAVLKSGLVVGKIVNSSKEFKVWFSIKSDGSEYREYSNLSQLVAETGELKQAVVESVEGISWHKVFTW